MNAPVRVDERLPVEQRGTTTLADAVVEKIAATAATEVDGAQGLRRHLAGRAVGSPAVRADVDLDGSVAALRLQIAVEFPKPVRTVTRDVRAHVVARVRELCDVTVDHVDITVAALPRPEQESRRVQ
ncbi:Asp23/Gls24 family envelope stress response protein [Jatrophihabitans sp. YIM 134969]